MSKKISTEAKERKKQRLSRLENEIIGVVFKSQNPMNTVDIQSLFEGRASVKTIISIISESAILFKDSVVDEVTLDVETGAMLYFENIATNGVILKGTHYRGKAHDKIYCYDNSNNSLKNDRNVQLVRSEDHHCYTLENDTLSDDPQTFYLYQIL